MYVCECSKRELTRTDGRTERCLRLFAVWVCTFVFYMHAHIERLSSEGTSLFHVGSSRVIRALQKGGKTLKKTKPKGGDGRQERKLPGRISERNRRKRRTTKESEKQKTRIRDRENQCFGNTEFEQKKLKRDAQGTQKKPVSLPQAFPRHAVSLAAAVPPCCFLAALGVL